MTSLLPNNFQTTQEPAIKSYSWTDFLSGLGYVTLYCIGGYDSTGKTYFLSTNPIYSSDENGGTGNLGTGTHSFDFDLDINTPITIAAANAIVTTHNFETSDNTGSITATLYRVDSSDVEHQIATGTSQSRTANDTNASRMVFEITCTKTRLNIGEKLRLTLTLNQSGNSGRINYTLEGNEESKIDIPFEVRQD